MGCTCKITKGGVIGERADGEPMHQWDREPCLCCKEYEERRNAQIPAAMRALGLPSGGEVPPRLQAAFTERMSALTLAARPL